MRSFLSGTIHAMIAHGVYINSKMYNCDKHLLSGLRQQLNTTIKLYENPSGARAKKDFYLINEYLEGMYLPLCNKFSIDPDGCSILTLDPKTKLPVNLDEHPTNLLPYSFMENPTNRFPR